MSDESSPPHTGNGRIDWADAVSRHRRWLWTVVYSRLGDVEAVEDVLQEVSVAAIERLPVLSDPSKVTAWLYRTAVFRSLSHRRRQGRRKRRMSIVAESNGQSDSPGGDNPLSWLLAEEERQLVRRAVESLRSKDRELLLLKYTEHWSCRELAERLGISVTAIETRLDRARRRLRRELAKLNVKGEDR